MKTKNILVYNLKQTPEGYAGTHIMGFDEVWELFKTAVSNIFYKLITGHTRHIEIMALDDGEKNYDIWITNKW